MSRQPYGINLYPNGDHAPNNAAAYNTSYRDGGPLGIEGEHGAGGYGGFQVDNNEHPNPLINGRGIQGPSDNHHRFANNGYGYPPHRHGDRSQTDRPLDSRAIERDGTQNNPTLYGTGPGGRQIQDVLSHISDHWHIMTEDECVPVHVTLQLMDHSSLGRGSDYQDFQRTSRHLQKALRSIVNG
ncbi:MAG: hypothetical protein Q9203_003603 [Teloschistes exilis]